jgi:predicted butyrate kinase (DUF1464 family)
MIFDEDERNTKFSLNILIPESKPNIKHIDMVSIVIGRGGSQIKQLQERTRTDIYIDSYKAEKSVSRCARITGRLVST